jgi:hypothetical protein
VHKTIPNCNARESWVGLRCCTEPPLVSCLIWWWPLSPIISRQAKFAKPTCRQAHARNAVGDGGDGDHGEAVGSHVGRHRPACLVLLGNVVRNNPAGAHSCAGQRARHRRRAALPQGAEHHGTSFVCVLLSPLVIPQTPSNVYALCFERHTHILHNPQSFTAQSLTRSGQCKQANSQVSRTAQWS